MAQHQASNQKTLRSALKHKKAADAILDSISALLTNVAAAKVKIAADTNATWDVNYASTLAVTAVDFDLASTGQHKSTMRSVIRSSMAHKRLADAIVDGIEDAQVSLNAVLAKMDAGAGTLDAVDANWDALAITRLVSPDTVRDGAQHKATLRKSLRSAISHKTLADFILDSLVSIESDVNGMITSIKAAN